jgi:TM2 domain-containing membrane protein YozV
MYKTLFLVLIVLAAACTRVPDQIEPALNHSVQDRYLRSLPSPFPPLSEEERAQDWGREMLIGRSFAKQLDLYQAITAFKRAEILIPPDNTSRLLEIQYEIFWCYYIALKYEDVIYTFENSGLKRAETTFPALHDMLLILYDTYIHLGEEREAQHTLQLIHNYFPEETPKLFLSKALIQADLPVVQEMEQQPPPKPYLAEFLQDYATQKKSISTAQTLNAFVPGAGYFYLGQKQSGITALLLNGLFIGASVYFFEEGNIPAGVIFTSFEAGWYFGGIYGAGLEAKYYNERLYERLATPMMNKERLFPILMLNYAF